MVRFKTITLFILFVVSFFTVTCYDKMQVVFFLTD